MSLAYGLACVKLRLLGVPGVVIFDFNADTFPPDEHQSCLTLFL